MIRLPRPKNKRTREEGAQKGDRRGMPSVQPTAMARELDERTIAEGSPTKEAKKEVLLDP